MIIGLVDFDWIGRLTKSCISLRLEIEPIKCFCHIAELSGIGIFVGGAEFLGEEDMCWRLGGNIYYACFKAFTFIPFMVFIVT